MRFKHKSCQPLLGAVLASLLLGTVPRFGQAQTLSLPADSPRWDLEEKAKATEYLGRKCLLLDGGAAVVKDFEMRDGVIDVDIATPAKRGFFGIQFRMSKDGAMASGFTFVSTSPACPMPCSTRRY